MNIYDVMTARGYSSVVAILTVVTLRCGLSEKAKSGRQAHCGASLRKQLVSDQFNDYRKVGKLPGKCVKESYKLEYGEDTMEVKRVFMMSMMMCLVLMMM